MIATQNQQTPKEDLTADLMPETPASLAKTAELSTITLNRSPILLSNHHTHHHPKAGINPLADMASYLFSIIGKMKYLKSHPSLSALQKELLQEVNTFQENAKNIGYNTEYIIVCRYVLCATLDDIISGTSWGGQGQWVKFSLLAAYNQDTAHQEKFFTIMERSIKEPSLYIDLMEVMYICLSMGYKGQYRSTEHNQYQLEQITTNLYKHIRAYRGNITKTLSPHLLKSNKSVSGKRTENKFSFLFIFFVTACVVMIIFISLSYLMDVISNEAYKDLFPMESSVLHNQ